MFYSGGTSVCTLTKEQVGLKPSLSYVFLAGAIEGLSRPPFSSYVYPCTSCLGVQKGKHSISPIFPLCLFLHFDNETIKGRWLLTMCLIHCPTLFLPGSIEGVHIYGCVRRLHFLFNLSYFPTVPALFSVESASFS